LAPTPPLPTRFARWARALAWVSAGFGLLLGAPHVALAASPYTEAPPHEEVVASPAHQYANMSNDDAYAELDRRGIKYTRVDPIGTVRAPIRLDGPLQGVHIHSALPEHERASSVFEILDARLALALDDYAVILARHDVVELVHYTMYRPNMPAPGSPEEKAYLAAQKKAQKEAMPKKGSRGGKGGEKDGKGNDKVASSATGKKEPPARTAKPSKERPPKVGGEKPTLAKGDKPTKGTRRTASEKRKDVDLPEEPLCGHDHHDHAPDADHAGEELAKGGVVAAASPKKREPLQARPGSRVRGVKEPRSAKKVIGPKGANVAHGKWAPPGTRHPAGLAIDVGILRKSDGSALNVATHWRGKIGEKTCGADAPVPETEETKEMRALVCEAKDGQIFTYALTPNFDAPHFDHFHMELKPGVEWFLYH
jgi:hypothetical protein